MDNEQRDKDTEVIILRRRWKPIKSTEAAGPDHEAIRIRMHRCFSWMQRVEELNEANLSTHDATLIYRWIALNSLYGQWDAEKNDPLPDFKALDIFLTRMMEHDEKKSILELLNQNKRLIEKILTDEHLNKHYWRKLMCGEDPEIFGNVQKVRHLYSENKYWRILWNTVMRVYLARCQLVHGAATFKGKLNRTALKHCTRFMELFLPVLVTIITENAWQLDWDGLCYPPQK